MPDKNQPPEAPREDPREAERKRTVEGVHSSLEALRQNIGKPDKNPQEKKTHLENLQQALVEARSKHTGEQSDKWKKFEESLKGELNAGSVEALEEALKDGRDVELDLKHLADEMGATEEYLEIQQDQAGKIYNRVDEAINKKFGNSKLMKKLKEWGISVEDIRNWIVNLIAGILEGFPIASMTKIAGGLRFRAALDDAKRDKLLDNKHRDKVNDPHKQFELDHDKGKFWTLEELWTSRYEEWLTRKRTTTGAFKEAPPTIREVLHPKKSPSLTQGPANPDLFGVAGLKQGASVDIVPEKKTINLGGSNVEIAKKDKQLTFTRNGNTYAINDGKVTNASLRAETEDISGLKIDITCGSDTYRPTLLAIVEALDGKNDGKTVGVKEFEKLDLKKKTTA